MDALLQAVTLIADPQVLLAILLASVFGLVVGFIPGLTATMATALLVPFAMFLEPVAAIAAIVARPPWRSSPATFPARCCDCPARRPLPPLWTTPTVPP